MMRKLPGLRIQNVHEHSQNKKNMCANLNAPITLLEAVKSHLMVCIIIFLNLISGWRQWCFRRAF